MYAMLGNNHGIKGGALDQLDIVNDMSNIANIHAENSIRLVGPGHLASPILWLTIPRARANMS